MDSSDSKTKGTSQPHTTNSFLVSLLIEILGAGAHTSSLGSKLSSNLKAVPTRLLTWGGFSPMFSGYSFGILPVSSCRTEQNREGDNWHRPGLSNTIWRDPQKQKTLTASRKQIFLSSSTFFRSFSCNSFSFFLSSRIFSLFCSSLTSESWEPGRIGTWGREGLYKECFLPFGRTKDF